MQRRTEFDQRCKTLDEKLGMRPQMLGVDDEWLQRRADATQACSSVKRQAPD